MVPVPGIYCDRIDANSSLWFNNKSSIEMLPRRATALPSLCSEQITEAREDPISQKAIILSAVPSLPRPGCPIEYKDRLENSSFGQAAQRGDWTVLQLCSRHYIPSKSPPASSSSISPSTISLANSRSRSRASCAFLSSKRCWFIGNLIACEMVSAGVTSCARINEPSHSRRAKPSKP